MSHVVYLDESGDLGWTLDKPYRHGGSSQFLTIAYAIVPLADQHKPKRIVRKIYKHLGFDSKIEMKGQYLDDNQLDFVAHQIVSFVKYDPAIRLGAITVKKQNVQQHIRDDGNKLYNYMIKLGLIGKIDKFKDVNLVRDNRSIKVKSGNSLNDYLQIVLWFERGSTTLLHDCPGNSDENLNLIFIDWVAHIIWSKYEDKATKHCDILSKHVNLETLFF